MFFRDILYCDENFTVRRGSIAVRDGRIISITENVPSGDYGETIDGRDRFLLPGLVNAHCHVPMTLLRGYGEGLPLDRWLNERVFPFEDRLTDDDVYWASLLGIAEMLASGVTSFTEMYDHAEFIAKAVELSGIKANLTRGVVSFDGTPLYGSRRHDEAQSLINNWNGAANSRIKTDTAIHAEYTSNETVVRQQAEFAQSRGLGLHVHVSETQKEHDDCVRNRGVTPSRYFDDCGIFGVRTIAAHCVCATDADIEIFAKRGVTAVHCPSSNLKLGSGIAPVPEMLVRGVNVALGTDGASSNNNLNMFEEIHLAALIHRGVRRDPEIMQPDAVLRMATVNGALSQGRADCGLIKEGYRADFAVLRTDKPHMTPVHDALSNVVFSAQGSDVEMTVVDGEIVYRDGEFLRFNVREAAEKAAAAAYRIAGEM